MLMTSPITENTHKHSDAEKELHQPVIICLPEVKPLHSLYIHTLPSALTTQLM